MLSAVIAKSTVVCCLLLCCHRVHANESGFTRDWVVEIDGADDEIANNVARSLNYVNLGRVSRHMPNLYHFQKNSASQRSRRSLDHHTRQLMDHPQVRWAEQQAIQTREKRDHLLIEENYLMNTGNGDNRYSRSLDVQPKLELTVNDPQWNAEWYLNDHKNTKRSTETSMENYGLKVIPVWRKNITGAGVVVCILDDGMELDHPDLKPNVDLDACYDFIDNDADPTPRYNGFDSHGTRCAGEVAMLMNNSQCGVGVAFNAKVGGIRMLGGDVTDLVEAKSLSFNLDHIDIFSCSWGPSDNGTQVEGPGKLSGKALEIGATAGRDGKGVIYVWAGGNGGGLGDTCACDGYVGSVFTIPISSVSETSSTTYYAEKCPAIMAATYSSGNNLERKVVSIDLNGTCTDQHSGTSAAAPLAAGILALVLEANPELTYRDIQHLLAWTSDMRSIKNQSKWQANAAGFLVSPNFGFGLMNADRLVQMAQVWKSVPEKRICEHVHPMKHSYALYEDNVMIKFTVDGCQESENEINFIEHIQVFLTIAYSDRGSLNITLISPAGMETDLLYRRINDHSQEGFNNWPFVTVHNWGESPRGTWQVVIRGAKNQYGSVNALRMVFHGTRNQPHPFKQVLSESQSMRAAAAYSGNSALTENYDPNFLDDQ